MNESHPDALLRKLGIELPVPPKAVGAYVAVVRTGNLVVTSGQLPWLGEKLVHTGKVGGNLTVEQGQEAALVCALNALAQLKAAVGDLGKVRQIVRLEGYVHCAISFRQHPQVLNGASDLMVAAFGDKGRHARTTVGVASLPADAAVEVEGVFEVA